MKQHLCLEDLTVGQKFASETYSLSEQQIIEFAREYDPQLFHTDPVQAAGSFFGGHAASGWQTAAVTMRLLTAAIPFDCGLIGIGADIVWPKPVRPRDVLRVEPEIIEIQPSRSRPERGVVTLRVETKNQHDDVVQILTTKILVFYRKMRSSHGDGG